MSLLQGGQGGFSMMPIIMVMGVFLIFSVMSGKKKEKKEKEKLEAIKPGQEIMMKSGIFGKVVKIDDRFAYIKISNGVQVKILKEGIQFAVDENTFRAAPEKKEKTSLFGGLFGKKSAEKEAPAVKEAPAKAAEAIEEAEIVEDKTDDNGSDA
ncbi:MAG: preprotein translocase subunit YajC [Fusobacteriaceae bacterium]|jgi:preprotein translocase subunit YajC|nr:preprotein translocase subunit YajC [Fusobacteriaceae bacterium]